MEITKIKGAEPSVVSDAVKQALEKLGYKAFVSVEGSRVNIQDVRLGEKWIKEAGKNLSPYTGKRGNILNWDNWVQVNNTINQVLDNLGVSANAHSLHGVFKIREGTKKYGIDDWSELAEANVGSIMNPVRRRDAWEAENPEKAAELLGKVIEGGAKTKFGVMSPSGVKVTHEIDLSKVKSTDPLAYAYGLVHGERGEPLGKPGKGEKFASEYIRGWKEGSKNYKEKLKQVV